MTLAAGLDVQVSWYLVPAWVFPVLVICLAGFLVYRMNRKRQERERRVADAARTNGWHWQQTDPSLLDRWALQPFGNGRRRQVRNVVYGEHNGWSFVAFDYQYITGGGRNSRRHDHAVYVLTLPGTLPNIQAEPEGIFGGRVARAFGLGDLELGDEELDRMWKVRSENEEFVRALFHERMRQLLLQTGGWTWGIERDSMVSAYSGTLAPEEIGPRIDLMAAVVGQIPDEVWARYGPAAAASN